MKREKIYLKDGLLTLGMLIVTFILNLLLQEWFHTQSLIPTVFVLGVFLISWRTQGYFWGIAALDLGANDYVTKPFGTEELLARVRAALRSRCAGNEMNMAPGSKFQLQDLVIDYDRRIVTVADREAKLTQTEYNILAYLSEYTGKVLTYSVIIRNIWGRMDEGSIKKLQVNMANIRKKLGSKPGDNRYIINELGVGYRMQE